MSRGRVLLVAFLCTGIGACGTAPQQGTLVELERVPADVDEIYLADSLERAAESYRRYLEETSESAMTPEAMRRLADLQIEQEYGVIGGTGPIEMAAPDRAEQTREAVVATTGTHPNVPSESDQAFEQRATQRQDLLSASSSPETVLPDNGEAIPAGPMEAIETYKKILETYPDYERNDQVLYQMSRAYDEIGQPDEAMAVMNQLVATYPHSRYLDEVYFRRGEYYFVRKKYIDAENSYGSIIRMGESSSYYELALYKQGWAYY